MISTADDLQAIGLAIEAETCGVSVERLALVNDVRSERVIVLAREAYAILHEAHRQLYRVGAAQGFTSEQVDATFHELLAAMMPVRREVH
jgi:hypothetical protein